MPWHGRPDDVVVDDEPRRLWLLFVGNGRYRPTDFLPAYRDRLDDRKLDVRMVDASRPFALLKVALAALTRTLPWCDVYRAHTAQRVRLAAAKGAMRLSVDGEVIHVTGDVLLRIDPRRLVVYRPAPHHGKAIETQPTLPWRRPSTRVVSKESGP